MKPYVTVIYVIAVSTKTFNVGEEYGSRRGGGIKEQLTCVHVKIKEGEVKNGRYSWMSFICSGQH